MEPNPQAWLSMAEALLIGLLLGIERESDREERHAGLRDFITIGLAGGLCGLLDQPWLTAAALLAITAFLIVFRLQTTGRTGTTTEIAAVATFLLCVLTTTPSISWGSPLAIALTVVLALFLDAREGLRRFFVEVITEREFHDTLRFLAIIFVILPVLPDGGYGPYEFFSPRRVWLFVILVCSISWLGYFLEKFLGPRHGLSLTGVLGGVASTTAATVAFAKQTADDPRNTRHYAHATVLANAVQCPRVFAILLFASPAVAWAIAPIFAAMTVAGLAVAFLLRRTTADPPSLAVGLRNPFRLLPALQFGALFAMVRLLARAASEEFGHQGVLWAGAIGGAVDVDAVAFSVSGLTAESTLPISTAVWAVLLALAANALFKTGLAAIAGGARFARQVLAGFAAMFIAALLALLIS